MRALRRALSALLLLALPAAAHADERILRLLERRPDPEGLLARGHRDDRRPRRARSRSTTASIATSRPAIAVRTGAQVQVGFTFEGATLDGQPVPAVGPARSATASRIKIGDPEQRLSTIGEHRYVIRYRTTRQIGRFKDYDELYWNATGNGWIFPIDVAEARIRLPEPVRFGQTVDLHRAAGVDRVERTKSSTKSRARSLSRRPSRLARTKD